MYKIKGFFKKAFTPITMMIVPHSGSRPLKLRVPLGALVALVVLWGFGMCYVFSISVRAAEYSEMSKKFSYLSGRFVEMRTTISSLEAAEGEFRRLFSLKSKKRVLEAVSSNETGDLDPELLRKQMADAMASVSEIKQYIKEERNAYFARPLGWPVPGALSSGFGRRTDPKTGEQAFHSGVDIRVPPGTPVKATADGIVSISGWVGGNGNIVAIEHGHDFSTAYAHNAAEPGEGGPEGEARRHDSALRGHRQGNRPARSLRSMEARGSDKSHLILRGEVVMFGKREEALTMMIGAESSLRGELQSKGTVRIDGTIDGTIQADWVILGESGLIRGDVLSRGTLVGGKLEGSIRCSETVQITPKGQVHGDIFTPRLSIAEGGIFDGSSHMAAASEAGLSTVLPLITTEK